MIKLAPITGGYIGILGGYYLYLTFGVIKQRFATLVPIGDGTNETIRKLIEAGKSGKTEDFNAIDTKKYDKLAVAIRAHANFGEFVPIIGTLSFLCELHGAPSGLLHVLLASFTIARISHVQGINAPSKIGVGRKIGAMVTFLNLGLLSAGSIYFSNKETIHALIGR